MIIDFNDETNQLSNEQLDDLKQLITYTLNNELNTYCEVSLSFVSDEQIKQLNAQYRQLNEPTDVLSFPLIDSHTDTEWQGSEEQPLALGDIVISIDRTIQQAEQFNHSFKRELSFLVVHGLLHLLGYTHHDEQTKKQMFTKQKNILEAFNIDRT